MRVFLEFYHPVLHIRIESLPISESTGRCENSLRGLRRQLSAGFRCARLHDHRPTLDRATDVQRPPDREIFSLMIQHAHFLRIEIYAALDIADEGVVGPTVPETGDDIVEFARPAIALIMLHLLVDSEIEGRIRIRCRDHVPSGAAATDVIEGRETAGDMKRLFIGSRARRDQAQAFGDRGECGQ